MSTQKKALLALIFANIIWGAASPIFKYSLQSIPPYSLALFRFSIGALILLPFAVREFASFKNEIKSWKEILAFSLSGVTFNIIFFFLGLQLTQSINAPIIGSSAPLLIMVTSAIFLKEKLSSNKVIGGTISFIGVLLIILEPLLEEGFGGSVLGNVFLVLATLSAVIQTLVGKTVTKKYPPIPLTFWAFVIGSITFLPLAIPEFSTLDLGNTKAIVGIVYGAVFSSAIAYSLATWGLSKIDASEAGIFAYIDPVAAIVIAYPLLGEKPTPLFILGSLLVFGGILLAEKRLQYHPIHRFFRKS